MARLRDFQGVEGSDFFEQDRGLQRLLSRLLPPDQRGHVFDSLHACAKLVSDHWNSLAIEASRPEQLPRIIKEDRVGNPVERVEFGPYTRQLRREVAEFGVLTKTLSEIHRFAMIYLLAHNGEASLMCGTSCTDGLVRVLDAKGPQSLSDRYREKILSVETPLAAAQFVTEQAGGSDVGAIESVAEPLGEGTWAITGEKWFCSNPDEYFVVAARPKNAPAGTRGVGLFFVPRVLPDGRVNRLHYRRLKDKLGTRSLPTAEMDFNGAIGFNIGDPSEGFHNLMNYVINTSRLHNAANALGFMHRSYLEARNYTRQREAFGGILIQYPLVRETLAGLLATLWRERVIFFRLLDALDRNGLLPADREQQLWQRCLINMAKYRTAVGLTAYVRDALLLLGANGTVEDFSILPRLLRDSIIIETWEGPHNTLCLQLLRDFSRFDFAGRWSREVGEVLGRWPADFLPATRRHALEQNARLQMLLRERQTDAQWGLLHARRLVDGLAGLLGVVWMAEMALSELPGDASAAALTAIAADQLWDTDTQRLEGTASACLAAIAPALIDEETLPPGDWIREL